MSTSSFDVPAVGRLYPQDALKLSLYFAAAYLSYNVVWAIYSVYFSPLSKFPGPPLWALSKWPHMMTIFRGTENIDIPALHDKYGPVVRIGPTQLSYAEGGKAWKDIYGFKKHGQPAPFKDPFFYGKPFNKVDNLITADDATHTRQRKMISHSFADKTLRELEPMLKYWVEKMKDKLGEKSAAGEKVDMLKYYNCTTFDIMGDLSFNEGLNMLEDGEYSPWVKTIFGSIKMASRIRAMKMISNLSEWFVKRYMQNNPKVLTIQAQHWSYTAERVDRRLAKTPERTDLWTRILEKSQGPDGLTLGEHQSNASLFMIAGTETTATALSGLTFHLLKNRKYLDLITREIRDNFKSFEDMDLESLQRLKYLHAVLQEGLRMYPPVPTVLPRRTPKGGSIICDQFVPEGTSIGVHQLSTYRNKDSFKDPYSFRPERWLGDPEFKNDHLDALEPFSVGPRNCLGKNLAWHEMRLIFATVLLKFDLELCEESDQWATQRVYTLWEKKPLMCRLTPAKA